MIAYLVRRVLAGLFLILSLGLATYVVFYTIPTNPACEVVDCGPGNHTTPEQLKAAAHEIGVDKPVLEQYGLVLWRIVDRGSLGHSFVGNESVNGIIERTLPVTASLVLGGAVLLLLLSVPLAIVAARRLHREDACGSLAEFRGVTARADAQGSDCIYRDSVLEDS